jgi:hypothetical protein
MLEAVGHPVNALRRVSFAGVELEGLPAGEFRVLLSGEVKALRKRVEDKKKRLSAPKGKFSKHKVPKVAEKKAEEKAPPKSKVIADKKAVRRPRNAPALPAAPPLERKGSKASKRPPRPRPSDFREEPRNPSAPSSRPPSNKPSSSKPPTSRPQRSEERPDRAPVAGRIQKRWKS